MNWFTHDSIFTWLLWGCTAAVFRGSWCSNRLKGTDDTSSRIKEMAKLQCLGLKDCPYWTLLFSRSSFTCLWSPLWTAFWQSWQIWHRLVPELLRVTACAAVPAPSDEQVTLCTGSWNAAGEKGTRTCLHCPCCRGSNLWLLDGEGSWGCCLNIFNHCCKSKKLCQSKLFIISKAIS